jgi:Holliday junction resolvase RusA-like endonuclease
MWCLIIEGTPIPQGSKTARAIGGRAVMFEANKKHKPWRALVTERARQYISDHGHEQLTGAIALSVDFYMPRPKTNKRDYMTTKPDLSKLTRSIEDALVDAGVMRDDSQIVRIFANKKYADTVPPCVVIFLHPMT